MDSTGGLAPQAAERFLERFGAVAPAVYSWACLHVREPLRAQLDPDDLFQEVAVRSFERFATFDEGRAEFRAWVFGIARNVLYKALSRLASSGSASPLGSPEPSDLADTATSISRRLARDESVARFLARVQRLTEEDRLLVLYRGLEGLSHEEVASRLGLSVAAATKRWTRLRERLRSESDAGFVAA